MKPKTILTIIAVILLSHFSFAQQNFDITIDRKSSTNKCTMGYLSVNDAVIGYSLELPWADNSNNISCIPVGTYTGILRYDKNDRWRIQLENVPNRTGVQIHIGNNTSQIKGCILIGEGANVDNCSVSGSARGYSKLKEKFYGSANPNSTPDCNIVLTFK